MHTARAPQEAPLAGNEKPGSPGEGRPAPAAETWTRGLPLSLEPRRSVRAELTGVDWER